LELQQSQVWKKLKERLHNKLEKLHSTLESDQTEAETAKTRGQIKAVREILAYENPPLSL
jgi:hypothetical protein